MANSNEATATVDAIKERVAPAFDKVDETLRQGRLVVARAQHATEDGVDAAIRQVQHHPLQTVALATGAGVLLGSVMGFALGWWARRS